MHRDLDRLTVDDHLIIDPTPIRVLLKRSLLGGVLFGAAVEPRRVPFLLDMTPLLRWGHPDLVWRVCLLFNRLLINLIII